MSSLKRKRLGRYTLLDRIAEGGSAEVYRGLEDRGHGIQRLVAVKVIHWELADETEFIDLFRAETKVSLGLNHPNIVQTFDFGEDEGGRPFIIFEYVHGRTLRALLDRLSEREARIPIRLALFIVEQAAKALQYAHAFEEPLTGRMLSIVHRDLSPQNLMISYEGVPKLIDFGIAKVAQAKDKTQTGLIKGKPAYLSPEQVNGEELDGRSDLFSLGIVLWEALTGAKLFAGGSPGSMMERIKSTSFVIEPPSKLNPDVPRELDLIVMKALARDRAERFQTAGELHALFHKLISRKSRDTHFAELSGLLGSLFAPDIAEEKAAIRRLTDEVEESTGTQLTDPSWLVPQPRPFGASEQTVSDIASAIRHVQELPPVAESSALIELETRSDILTVPAQPAAPVATEPPPEPAAPVAPVAPEPEPEPEPVRPRAPVAPPERFVPPRSIFQAALPTQNEFTERYGRFKPSLIRAALFGVGFSSIAAGVAFMMTRSPPEAEKPPEAPVAIASPVPAPAMAPAPVKPRKVSRAKKPAKTKPKGKRRRKSAR